MAPTSSPNTVPADAVSTGHETAAPEVSAKRTPPKVVNLLGLTLGLGAILVVLLLVFIMPSLKSGPRDLPLGVVGDPAAVEQLAQGLDSAAKGAFVLSEYATADHAEQAVRDREVVGALAVGADGVEALVASAGSAAISSTVSATATALADQVGLDAVVTDVVPLPEGDPTGIGIGGLAFPLVFGGIVPAVAFRKVFARHLGWAIAGILAFAAVGGVLVASVLMFVFGSIEGAFWPVAGAMALGIAGLAIPLAGLQELFGGKGFTIGAMLMMFVGNPLAGISTGAAWLPAGLGVIGQVLPPGASGTLVRAAAYFGGTGGGIAALTLGSWIAAGVVLLVIAQLRARRSAPE